MSERNSNCKRDSELEASSISVSPLKKTKLHDSSSDSPNIAFADSSSSSSSVASSDSGECSVTSAGEYDDQSSSICSGCFSNETSEIARNGSTFVIDLEAHQISETETSTTFFTGNFREERNSVSEALGETTETESSLATERDDRRKRREVSKSPTADEIEELFCELENDDKQKRFNFIAKYNFDIVNDEPLQGRYKWDRLA